ncbi:MAG: hypothetical protein AB4062_12160 [Crocosphaera sp.]
MTLFKLPQLFALTSGMVLVGFSSFAPQANAHKDCYKQSLGIPGSWTWVCKPHRHIPPGTPSKIPTPIRNSSGYVTFRNVDKRKSVDCKIEGVTGDYFKIYPGGKKQVYINNLHNQPVKCSFDLSRNSSTMLTHFTLKSLGLYKLDAKYYKSDSGKRAWFTKVVFPNGRVAKPSRSAFNL